MWCEKILINNRRSFKRKKFCNSYCQAKWHYHKKSKKELEQTRICRWCKKSILHKHGSALTCNDKCLRRYQHKKFKKKSAEYQRRMFFNSRPTKINDNEKDKYVMCLICKKYYKQISSGHLRAHHNIKSTIEYRKLFPKAKIMSKECHNERSKIMDRINPTKGTKRPQYVRDALSKANKGRVPKTAWKVGDTALEKNSRWIDGEVLENMELNLIVN